MTGWNLPPGVNVSDIPGNRKIDAFLERECNSCDLSEYDGKCPVDYDADKCPKNILDKFYNKEMERDD